MTRWVAGTLALTTLAASIGAHAQTPVDAEESPGTPSPDAPKPVAPKARSTTSDESPREDAGDEASMRRYPPSSVRLPLILGGSFVTLAAYGITVASALTWDDVPGADAMLVPIVGPWIAVAQNGCAPDDPDCGAILWIRGILLVIDGIAQAGGLGLIGEGIFMTTEADAPAEKPATSWMVAPVVTPTQTGIGVIGSF